MKKHTDVPSPSEEAELLKDLESQGQTHVFEALTDPSLSPENKNHILSTLKHFNIKRLPILLEAYASKSNLSAKPNGFTPLKPEDVRLKSSFEEPEASELSSMGLETIRKGDCGVLMLAAGDGKRLGCEGPKALFKLPDGRTILQYFIEMIAFLDRKVGEKTEGSERKIPIYIIINEHFFETIRNYLEENKFFGYEKIVLQEVETETLMVDSLGRIAMKNRSELLRTGGGNGQIVEFANQLVRANSPRTVRKRFGQVHPSLSDRQHSLQAT